MNYLIRSEMIDPAGIDLNDPLGFLTADGTSASITEAAYRYCRYESSGAVTFTGTGNAHHLEENVRAINLPPLPREHVARLDEIFGALDTLTGQEQVDDKGNLEGKPKGH